MFSEGTKKNKKRKERDDDDSTKQSKVYLFIFYYCIQFNCVNILYYFNCCVNVPFLCQVLKQNSFDKIHIPRLSADVLKHLDEKLKKDSKTKKANVTSTSSFVVEETKTRRNKPSNYLEESIYLNDDGNGKNLKPSIKKPKVLPFIPTASTSDSGFTTNFKVSLISRETQFVAQSTDLPNFKNDYLNKKRIKKLGTFELYKRQRNIKISKF